MPYGICHLSLIALRAQPVPEAEMVNQLLFGEHFKILEQRKKWTRIKLNFDGCEGWVNKNQFREISKNEIKHLNSEENFLVGDLLGMVAHEPDNFITVPLGAHINSLPDFPNTFEGVKISGKKPKLELINTAYLYLNAPFLWGGKSPFGIDGSGFTQMVYKLNGHKLFRKVAQQAQQGEALSFIEESEPGDLAFFDDKEGIITHVGIIMKDHYIIHSHGKVRIDRLDHTGIYNPELKTHTHKLRVIKKVI